MQKTTLLFAFTFALAAAPLAGCQKKGRIPVAPAAKRPKPQHVAKPEKTPLDCKPTVIEQAPPSVPYKARVIVESNNLSARGITMLKDAAKEGIAPDEREQMIEEAVDELITALKADPYNVEATYALSAGYASIGRPQCSINLLERLALLRKLASQTRRVESKVDVLLGRGRFQGRLDASFSKMRAKRAFRDVVEKLIAPL